jgi:predicted ester cyclase
MPADVKLTPIDRTVANSTVVDEFIFEFTHDTPMDWMLPGIAPTGRKVRVPFVVVVKFEGDKVCVFGVGERVGKVQLSCQCDMHPDRWFVNRSM